MNQILPESDSEKPANAFSTILFAGLLAGFLDGAAASVNYYIASGNSPTRVFQYIASAVFGKKAYSGGVGMVVWGLIFHFLIALIFSGLLFLVYPVLYRLLKSKLIMGIVYGLIVWVIMNLVVVPLTNAARFPFSLKSIIIGVGILIFMVGIPIALIVHQYYAIRKINLLKI